MILLDLLSFSKPRLNSHRSDCKHVTLSKGFSLITLYSPLTAINYEVFNPSYTFFVSCSKRASSSA